PGSACGLRRAIRCGARVSTGSLRQYKAVKKSHSSKQWLRRHVNDPYVQRSKREGYRSRSAYKLIEIDEKDRFLRPGMVLVDLGAAPGGWSQVAAKRAGKGG